MPMKRQDDNTSRNNESTKSVAISFEEESTVARKGKFNLKGIWRETQLAQPKMPQEKYTPPYDGPLRLIQKSLVIETEILHRCNNLANTHLRTIQENRAKFREFLSDRKLKNLVRAEDKIINSIYYVYKKHQMMEEQKQLRLMKRLTTKPKTSKKKGKKEPKEQPREDRIGKLAIPKKVFKSERVSRGKWKPIEDMNRYVELAEPVRREEIAQRSPFTVSQAAKNYIATDIILKLYQQPRRFDDLEPPLEASRPVPRSALTYKMTPRLEKLYVVKIRKEGTTSVPEEEIFKISPNALKYKATPRILQLAKPIERS